MIAHRHSLPQAPGVEKEQAKTVDVEPIAKSSGSLVALDIDTVNNGPEFVPTLAADIYASFRSREASTSVRPLYMEDQEEVSEHMRMILVDWLVEVHNKFGQVHETLFLAVNILDRYLSKSQVKRDKLQLVGVTAIAARVVLPFLQLRPASLADCIYICDKAYTDADFFSMEEQILNTLEHRVTIPSAHAFLLRFLMASEGDTEIIHRAYFILDGTLQSYYLLHFLPSQLAAAAVFVARKIAGREPWTPTLEKYTAYREDEVLPVARAVVAVKTFCSAGLHAVNTKYATDKYSGVSKIKLPTEF